MALINTISGGAGNICTLNGPKMQYNGITPSERDGIATLDINCLLTQNTDAGNDEWSLVLT